MDVGGRALRHYAIASVLRSTAHCSYRRMAPIPNAVVLLPCLRPNNVLIQSIV